MQQKNPAENFFDGMQSTFKKMMENAPVANPFDMQAMMEAQRKNMQAIAEANKCMMQGWQTLARRQGEMASQFMQDNASFGRQPAEGKKAYETSIATAQEMVEIMRKSAMDAAEIINRRVVAGMNEIKSTARDE